MFDLLRESCEEGALCEGNRVVAIPVFAGNDKCFSVLIICWKCGHVFKRLYKSKRDPLETKITYEEHAAKMSPSDAKKLAEIWAKVRIKDGVPWGCRNDRPVNANGILQDPESCPYYRGQTVYVVGGKTGKRPVRQKAEFLYMSSGRAYVLGEKTGKKHSYSFESIKPLEKAA